MAPGRKERIQRKSFVRPVREEVHKQALTHYLLDANLHHLGDASAGDTRTEHGFHVRHEETPLCRYLRDLLTPMKLPLKGLGRHGVIKHDSLMPGHLLRFSCLPGLSKIRRRRDRNKAVIKRFASNKCPSGGGPKRTARSNPSATRSP